MIHCLATVFFFLRNHQRLSFILKRPFRFGDQQRSVTVRSGKKKPACLTLSPFPNLPLTRDHLNSSIVPLVALWSQEKMGGLKSAKTSSKTMGGIEVCEDVDRGKVMWHPRRYRGCTDFLGTFHSNKSSCSGPVCSSLNCPSDPDGIYLECAWRILNPVHTVVLFLTVPLYLSLCSSDGWET